MPILASELKFYKSSETGSVGGTITATEITDEGLNNLFDDVTADEAEAGLTDYRKIFIKNTNGSLTLQEVYLWIQSLTTSDDDEIAIALGTSSDTDGSAVTYEQPVSKASGLSIGSLAAGASQGIWIRRTVSANGVAQDNNQFTLSIEGST